MKSAVDSSAVVERCSSMFVRRLVEDNSREIIQSACRSIGSVKDNEFDVRFNPDLFQPHVTLEQSVETAVDNVSCRSLSIVVSSRVKHKPT
jgi:hypothetical protein